MAENQDQNKETQREAGDEALEGNTGVGGSVQPGTDAVDQGQDSDGNSGVMTNDEFEKDEVAGGGDSLREPPETGEQSSPAGS